MKNNIFLIGLAILSVILLFLVQAKDPSLQAHKSFLEKKPQEYMSNAFVTVFTETGALKNELSAKYWAYLPERKVSTLNTPHITAYKPDGTIWHIDAKNGKVSQPNIGTIEKITLQNQVVLKRPVSSVAEPIQLETEEIDYQPKQQYAETNQFVTMNKPGLTITGVGLRAFLDKGAVELLNNVKTYYTVNR